MPMPALRPCLSCGHSAQDHQPVDFGSYTTHDGALVRDMRLGGCDHADGCACRAWDPDTLSHVSELLGLDVRRIVLVL